MSPLRGLVLALSIVSTVWGVLSVPWETAYSHPPGSVHVPAALVHPHSSLWSPPAPMSVEELAQKIFSDITDIKPPVGAAAVQKIRWDHWLVELAVRWVLLGAVAWPLLTLASLRLPAFRSAARFSLGLVTAAGLCTALWFAGAGWGPPAPAGFALAGVLVGRAAASPEAGGPWLGMSSGLRPLGILATAVVGAAALSVAALLMAAPMPAVGASVAITLGFAGGIALAPTGGIARAAWHLGVVLVTVGVGEFAVGAVERLVEWFSLGLSPRRLPGEMTRGLLALLVLSALLTLAALLVAGLRRLRLRFLPCAN
jgi:hypothetical protein